MGKAFNQVAMIAHQRLSNLPVSMDEPVKKEDGWEIQCYVGTSEGANITISLIETGQQTEDGRDLYDADFNVGNDDSVGPRFMVLALAIVVDEFYRRELDKRFALIGE
jgi:hypothetical protein